MHFLRCMMLTVHLIQTSAHLLSSLNIAAKMENTVVYEEQEMDAKVDAMLARAHSLPITSLNIFAASATGDMKTLERLCSEFSTAAPAASAKPAKPNKAGAKGKQQQMQTTQRRSSDINEMDSHYETPLMLAAVNKRMDALQFLIANGVCIRVCVSLCNLCVMCLV